MHPGSISTGHSGSRPAYQGVERDDGDGATPTLAVRSRRPSTRRGPGSLPEPWADGRGEMAARRDLLAAQSRIVRSGHGHKQESEGGAEGTRTPNPPRRTESA